MYLYTLCLEAATGGVLILIIFNHFSMFNSLVVITPKNVPRRQIKDSLYSEAATESCKVADLL